jgi:Ku protein
MAPRANWKGFLRLSLVTCPVALFPATSDSEKISFNQINRKTGHRIRYLKVDADTGDEVEPDDIVKGYKIDTDTYITSSRKSLRKSRSTRREPSRSTSSSTGPASISATSFVPTISCPKARSGATLTR